MDRAAPATRGSVPVSNQTFREDRQRFVACVAITPFPTINLVLVLLAEFPRDSLVVMPLASATVAFLLSRRLVTPIASAIVIAM
jgi:hypothetical protein